MPHSIKDHVGQLTVDHRESPGLDPAILHHLGMPLAMGKGLFEADVKTCSHCQRMVVLEMRRVRPRAYCPKCNEYICDGCDAVREATGECVPFRKIEDQFLEAAARQVV